MNLQVTFILYPLNMKKRLSLPVLFIISLFVFSNASAQVFSDYDGHADFKKYKTFAWIAPGDSVLNRFRPDKVFGGFIMHTANQELKNKGMVVDTIRPSAIFLTV